jgi:putative bacteriocin precursor
MKKLNRRNDTASNTIEAYSCYCYCICSCGCYCFCFLGIGSYTNTSNDYSSTRSTTSVNGKSLENNLRLYSS